MVLTVSRSGKPPLVLRVAPNGFTPHMSNFGFGMADMSELPKSDSRTLLEALATDDAESLNVSITDPRNAKLKLEFTVPVAGKQADFRTLMTGLEYSPRPARSPFSWRFRSPLSVPSRRPARRSASSSRAAARARS
jgi:hypothetical protein